MFGNKFSYATAVLGFILIITCLRASSVGAQRTMPPPNSMWVDRGAISFNQYNASVGTRFNVTLWVNVNTSSFTWQVGILFNKTLLQATRAGVTGGSTSQFFAGHSTLPTTPVIDNTTGWVFIGETLLGNDSRTAGNGSLAWFEFEIVDAPNSTVTSLTGALDITNPSYNYILTPDLTTIPTTNIGAAYSFIYVIPEFPSFLILPLFMATTLLAAMVYRRKRSM